MCRISFGATDVVNAERAGFDQPANLVKTDFGTVGDFKGAARDEPASMHAKHHGLE
jgi:hypothetical protein